MKDKKTKKIKPKAKKTKVKKIRKQKFSFLQKLYILLILILSLALLSNKPNFNQHKSFAQVLGNIPLTKIATEASVLTLPVLQDLSPTPTPAEDESAEQTSPQPTNPSDFCIHVPVLMYHHIQPQSEAIRLQQTPLSVDSGVFDIQMSYLIQSGYTPIWANDLISALITKTQIQGKPILITIDDGYSDNFIYALPVLQKYNIKANIMLASGLMGNQDMLTWDQVNGLNSSGLIHFTNHTWSHYAISDGAQDKIEAEIDIAKNEIQSATGQNIDIFTYPFGSFNQNSIETLKKKGYIGAFSTIGGQDQCDSFIFTLHRTRIGNDSLSAYGI